MTDDSPLGFSAPWYALGVVTPKRLAALEAEWATGEDRNPEHYRWRAFRAFVAEQPRPFAPDLAAALYALGAGDPDQALSGSIMDVVVRLPECPEPVLETAARSGRAHLVRLVERRRAAGGHR